jgi:glycosyltransferase involved in cell wall biosynthesis
MKLFFDAVELSPRTAKSIGIYRYAMGLAAGLAAQLQPSDTLVLACNGDNQADLQALLPPSAQVRVLVLQPGMPGHLWRQQWQRIGCAWMMRRLGVDAYLSPKGFVPRDLGWPRQTRRLCVVHDLIPFWYFKHHPAYFGAIERKLVGGAYRHALRKADRIIAISEATRAELLAWPVPADRLVMVHNGVDTYDGHGAPEPVPVPVPGPYVFAMASGLPHKNLPGLLAAYRAYRAQAQGVAWPLLLCGTDAVSDEGVMALGRVSDAALRGLYQGADLFLFLSQVEGFGYPPIEALSAGTPVLCSDLPVFREVCGDLVDYVDPNSAHSGGQAIFRLTQARWRAEQRSALMQRASQHIAEHFNWTRCAQGVMQAVRDAVAQRSPQPHGVKP